MTWFTTVIDLSFKGGIFMIPLALVALAALILMVERMLYLRGNRIDGDRFQYELRTALKDNALDQAIVLAARTKGVVGRVVEEGLMRVKDGEKDIESATEKAILTEMMSMERSRGWLVTLSQLAPLLGILGTVQGLVIAFMTIEASATTDPRLLAGGIYTALVTTVAGLVIAIPIIAFLEYVRKETNHILSWLDLSLVEIKEWLARRNGMWTKKEAAGHA